MDILFVTALPLEMNTSSMIRNFALIRGLVETNHNVSILSPEGETGSVFCDKTILEFLRESKTIRFGAEGASSLVKRAKANSKKSCLVRNLRRVFKLFSVYGSHGFVIKAFSELSSSEKKYDLVISSSDPKASHLLVMKYLRENVKWDLWIQYWGDPLAQDITATDILPRWIKKHEERKLLNAASKIVYVSPLTLDEQRKVYPNAANKMYFLPTPYLAYSNLSRKSESDKIKIGYFGNYNRSVRNIEPLYNIVSRNPKFELIIAGDSEMKLDSRSNIQVYPRIDIKRIHELEKECDILVCITNKKGSQIPGKLYQYAGTSKDVLVILDGNIAPLKAYLASFERFDFCVNEEHDIQNALNQYDENKLGKQHPCEALSPSAIAEKFIAIVSN